MPRKKHIPQHRMTSHSPHGLLIRYMKDETFQPPHEVSVPHRDDHYAFIYQQSGNNQLFVDFKTVKAKGRCIFCLLPGQVHQVVNFNEVDTWFVAVAPDLVPEHVRRLFEQSLQTLQPSKVNESWAVKLKTGLSLLQLHFDDPMFPEDPFHLVKSAADNVLSMFAAIYREQEKQTEQQEGRAAEVTRKFKILLRQKYMTTKSPAAYAAILNVSPAYLNELVKGATGMPVSQWIHQEIILEAKRMLYYTDVTVKEIAVELGYEDHAYFTRLFSKIAGMSPIAFRQKSRK